ncbi:retrovirus-related pol polyprotein from transposon TNT 1-94 [Tanacetum coccineum]
MTVAKYNSQDENAHSTILLSLSDGVLYEVADEETATGVWKKLETIYMTKSLTNKLLLKQRLFSLRMKEGSSLKEHLDALNSILMDLKNVEVKIEDEDAALALLVSLPPSELRQQASGSGYESQSMGLSTTSRDRGRYRFEKGKDKGGASLSSQGPNPRDICNYCKKTGHWKNDCPKLKEKALVTTTAKDDSCYSGSECDLL